MSADEVPILDFEDDDLGLLEEEPWDAHELEEELKEEENYD